jgi:hypothetical protein
MNRRLLGRRLEISCAAIVLIAELLFGAGVWLSLRMSLFDAADTTLQGRAADMERYLEARKGASTAQLQAEFGEKYRIERSEDYLEIGLCGASIYRSRFLQEHPLPGVSLSDLDRPRYRNFKLGNRRFRAVSEQIEVEGRVYAVRIAKPMDEENEALTSLRRYLLVTGSFLLLIAYAVGNRLSRRIVPENQIR